jgi:hypothetical protein
MPRPDTGKNESSKAKLASSGVPVHSKPDQLLSSWKEIAVYLGRGVRTVQRLEQKRGLPVRRPYGANTQIVLARTSDLDRWMQSSTAQQKLGLRHHVNVEAIERAKALAASIKERTERLQINSIVLKQRCGASPEMKNTG